MTQLVIVQLAEYFCSKKISWYRVPAVEIQIVQSDVKTQLVQSEVVTQLVQCV